jgi:hypothetical protein
MSAGFRSMATLNRVYSPLLTRFRAGRIRTLYRECGITARTRVLDVGGGTFIWDLAERLGLARPRVVFLNYDPQMAAGCRHFVRGDGRRMPFRDGVFDLVHSNSVIEHVGGEGEQRRFAEEVRRVGRRYFVQTPDVLFPLEPHLLAPAIHWLPEAWRAPVSALTPASALGGRELARRLAREVRLLNAGEVREFFPGCTLIRERFLGWPKSIIALG